MVLPGQTKNQVDLETLNSEKQKNLISQRFFVHNSRIKIFPDMFLQKEFSSRIWLSFLFFYGPRTSFKKLEKLMS